MVPTESSQKCSSGVYTLKNFLAYQIYSLLCGKLNMCSLEKHGKIMQMKMHLWHLQFFRFDSVWFYLVIIIIITTTMMLNQCTWLSWKWMHLCIYGYCITYSQSTYDQELPQTYKLALESVVTDRSQQVLEIRQWCQIEGGEAGPKCRWALLKRRYEANLKNNKGEGRKLN